MTMRAARFSQADIARALRAARQVGGGAVVEIAPDGTIRITPPPKPQEEVGAPQVDRKKEIRL
jgi:hypothetical protein